MTISGTLADGSQAPVGETVAVTLDGVEQSATIGFGGAFTTTGLTVASSPDTVNYAYTSDGTFASASTTSTLTVNPATLTITADAETKVYGTADPALAYTASGFQFHDTAGSVLTGALARAQAGTLAGEQAGGYAISQGTLAANSNYTISFTAGTLTITPAPLTVTANAQTKVYGSADPTLAYTSSGFQFSDTAATVLTGSLARAAGETVSGSPYAIGQGTLTANSNYTIHYTGSSLSITPATPVVTVSDPGGTYTAHRSRNGHRDGCQWHGGPEPGRRHADPDVLRRNGHLGHGPGLSGASRAGTYTVVAHFPSSTTTPRPSRSPPSS